MREHVSHRAPAELDRAKRMAPFAFTGFDRKINWRKLRALNVDKVVSQRGQVHARGRDGGGWVQRRAGARWRSVPQYCGIHDQACQGTPACGPIIPLATANPSSLSLRTHHSTSHSKPLLPVPAPCPCSLHWPCNPYPTIANPFLVLPGLHTPRHATLGRCLTRTRARCWRCTASWRTRTWRRSRCTTSAKQTCSRWCGGGPRRGAGLPVLTIPNYNTWGGGARAQEGRRGGEATVRMSCCARSLCWQCGGAWQPPPRGPTDS